MGKIRVKVYRELCISCGSCWALCPEVFDMGDDAKCVISEKYRASGVDEGEVNEDLKECVEIARNSCPSGAISA